MEELFELFLEQSEKLRNGYRASLLPVNDNWFEILNSSIGEIPELLKVIYSKVSGTNYETDDQKFMDFLPGYLLIHINEYAEANRDLQNILKSLDVSEEYVPLLRNYSSDFVAVKKDSGAIYELFHDDDEIYLIHKTSEDFLKTINAFYSEKVFFTDEDGYLDYDEDLQYEVGRQYNPDVEYWVEE